MRCKTAQEHDLTDLWCYKVYDSSLIIFNDNCPQNYLQFDSVKSDLFQYSYSWGVFLLFHVNFTHLLHTMSIWYNPAKISAVL